MTFTYNISAEQIRVGDILLSTKGELPVVKVEIIRGGMRNCYRIHFSVKNGNFQQIWKEGQRMVIRRENGKG